VSVCTAPLSRLLFYGTIEITDVLLLLLLLLFYFSLGICVPEGVGLCAAQGKSLLLLPFYGHCGVISGSTIFARRELWE